MNIKTKILIPSVVAVVIMLLLGTVSYFGMRSIRQALDEVAGSNIQNVVTQVQQTATHAGTARDSIERIRANAGQSEGFAHEITAALDEQSQASNLLAQQVEGITQMSERNSQSVASAGTAMREL